MKQILIVCLLGMGLLLPQNKVTAKEFYTKRIVDVWIEGAVLTANSDAYTGGITEVQIYNSSDQKVLAQSCGGGYSCQVSLSGLPGGTYRAKVTTTLTTYNEYFSI